MKVKKLLSPEFCITLGKYELDEGISVECFSSQESQADWCKVVLDEEYEELLDLEDMEEAVVELGYEEDYDILLEGNIRKVGKDYWQEILIKDDMLKLERIRIKDTFIDCYPQDIVKYILSCAGISD